MALKVHAPIRWFTKNFSRRAVSVVLILGLGLTGQVFASAPVKIGLIEGRVFVVTDEAPPQKTPLTKTPPMQFGLLIQTEPDGLVEFLFSDSVTLRLGPSSRLRLFPAEGETVVQYATIALLLEGEAWVNMVPVERKRQVKIATESCLMETDAGVFRITLHSDRAVEIKDYKGTLKVRSPLKPASGTAAGKKWEMELHPLTKMVVWPEGRVASPFRFAAKPDQTEWVLWNHQRDEMQGQKPDSNQRP